ncbi:hypothetical protein AAFF_G00160330 [Aldrovandia affinis]|uniref:Suppressor of cytokine signaling 1 n=1 Tax=Aldrovandia affinis TaxID=143900 RepID=A0AAD7RN72_9TELE|nr:hypothetical protein AAFF_G00160330 [Aldrovandia affinis]
MLRCSRQGLRFCGKQLFLFLGWFPRQQGSYENNFWSSEVDDNNIWPETVEVPLGANWDRARARLTCALGSDPTRFTDFRDRGISKLFGDSKLTVRQPCGWPRSERDFRLIATTSAMLEDSGFYWGPMTVEDAHARLRGEPTGTFLIRDSRRQDFFFTLSYRSASGPVSVRIAFQGSRFGLAGGRLTFESLFALLEHYAASPKRSLTAAYRKSRLRSLQELCRQRIVETWGAAMIERIPVNAVLKDFLRSFPFRL